MRLKLMATAGVLAVTAFGGSACAMDTATNRPIHCTVTGADKFGAALGGAEGVCRTMESAMTAAAAPGDIDASVAVEIVSPHAAVARVTANGRSLPEQRIDISDRPLNQNTIERLAQAVAVQLQGLASASE